MSVFKSSGVKTISIAVSDASFALSATQGILDFASANGMTLNGAVHSYNSSDDDAKMTKMLTALQGYNADAFFSVSQLEDGEQVLKICDNLGFYPKAFWYVLQLYCHEGDCIGDSIATL
jgi:ABC-type branched-subunit amino acid transport system substrate-binding protein